MGALTSILMLILVIAVVVVFYPKIVSLVQFVIMMLSNKSGNIIFPNSTSIKSNQTTSYGPLVNYTLSLINKDRASYGLSNVTVSPTTSAQQHGDSMLQYNYFSHWDIYGMKPYMRYTLVGGTGSVEENIAYTKSGVKACIGTICNSYGNINITSSLQQMEYNMVYNDSGCCKNGHRDNILDPNHNQVSIGISYNSTTIYLVEDFVNNYISWFNNTPNTSNNSEVSLKGATSPGYQLSSIEVTYDQQTQIMSPQQLNQTSEYGYGQSIAGIVSSALDYYPDLTTIVADNYYTKGNDFLVSFNMTKLIKQYGQGEYTVMVWLNGTASNGSFVGSTYTVFVNSSGQAYTPSNV